LYSITDTKKLNGLTVNIAYQT